MKPHITYSALLTPFLLLASAPLNALAGDVLQTGAVSSCQDNADIEVQDVDIAFDRATKKIKFNVKGSSKKSQKVKAVLSVKAYGIDAYSKEFNPCDGETKVDQLCPVPEGSFAATGEQSIPDNVLSQIPSIAFSVPDLDSQATMQLKSIDDDRPLACITSQVSNGKTLNAPGVTYAAVGMAVGAVALSGLSAALAHGAPGNPTHAPSAGDVIGVFQSFAMIGMMSADKPVIVNKWSENFAFSTGLIRFSSGVQEGIDSFRNKTGGNLTENSVAFLKQATLVTQEPGSNITKRGLDGAHLFARQISTSVNESTETSGEDNTKMTHFVKGIQRYSEELSIPNGNTFMTVLLVFAIVVAAITVGILLFKVILETWAMFGSFPKRLTGFRKRYWWTLAKTITNLILVLYGIWTLYCVYQFKNGDSWAAKLLAGVTLGLFTGILVFFTWKIWSIAHRYKKMEGDSSALYDDKDVWRKYSIFYENYKKSYWWIFVPAIIYMFSRGCVIAGADGHGLAQAAGQLVVESLLLAILLWSRPFSLKSSNWINITIQVVRVLSVVCILVFVEELGVAQTTKTVTGLVLVVMQAVLTGLLAILIAVNAIVVCCKQNPHRKKRKAAEKARDLDNLTPLDARNSLLMDPKDYKRNSTPTAFAHRGYDPIPLQEQNTAYQDRRLSGKVNLLSGAAGFSQSSDHRRSLSSGRSMSPTGNQAPTLPPVEIGAHNTVYSSQGPWQPQNGYRDHAY